MRYTKNKRDANEGPIVEYLRACGYYVWLMMSPCPFDLLVWRRGFPQFVVLEVKGQNGRPTEQQATFWEWTEGLPRYFVRTPEAALESVQRHC